MKVHLLVALLLLVAVLVPNSVRAAEPLPGDACTTANYVVTTGGPETGGARYFLRCNGTTWVQEMTFSSASNYTGILTTTPAAPLHVNGEAIIGPNTTGIACTAAVTGGLRWDSADSTFQMCDGTSWRLIAAGSSSCGSASGLSFTSVTGAALNTVYSSNVTTITFSGCSTGQSVSVTGAATAQISVNGGTWGTSGVIYSGQTLQTRLTSSASGSTMLTATVTVGGSSTNWTVTTAALDPCTGTASSPSIGAVCTDGSIYAGQTPDGNVPMYVTPCDAGQTWNGSSCTGTRALKKWSYGASITTGYNNSSTGKSNTANEYGLNANADGPYEAATYCYTLNYLGHTDWYLPATGELNVLYVNKAAITNFDTTDGGTSVGGGYPGVYWTSTELSNAGAWTQSFSDGSQYSGGKNVLLSVRCVRR